MDVVKEKWKKNLIVKTWKRFRSLGALNKKQSSQSQSTINSLTESKACNCTTKPSKDERVKTKCKLAPEGCFSVYVGPQKQRFVVKIELANHPLFKMLLEDAELEYGYNIEGPILLPCEVDLFYKVLAAMDSGDEISPGWNFPKVCCPFILCSPARRSISCGNKGYGAFSV